MRERGPQEQGEQAEPPPWPGGCYEDLRSARWIGACVPYRTTAAASSSLRWEGARGEEREAGLG